MKHLCQDCNKLWREEDLVLPIKDIFQRVLPGEPMPSGECPECGALCHVQTGKYSVLVKTIANVRIDNIEAKSQLHAIEIAKKFDMNHLLRQDYPKIDGVRYVEWGEEDQCYLVDEDGDEEYERSCWYGKDGKTSLEGDGNTCATQLCEVCLRPFPKAEEVAK
jgi:uncharacterized membrane-anchored protein